MKFLISAIIGLIIGYSQSISLTCSPNSFTSSSMYYCFLFDNSTLNHCSESVSGVRWFCPHPLLYTYQWKRGVNVVQECAKLIPTIQRYTAIATFNADGTFYNGHAAVFIQCGQSNSIAVADQFQGKFWNLRAILPTQSVNPVFDSRNFFVVEY